MPLGLAYCPFAGRVTLHGPADPLLAGTMYRVMLTNTKTGARGPLINGFQTVDQWGHTAPSATTHWMQDAAGWRTWLGWHENSTGLLGWFDTAGDEHWLLELELGGPVLADTVHVQLDNTLNANGTPVDADNRADLELDVAGQCEVNVGDVTGRFIARDAHFASWDISVHGGPTGGFPGVNPPTTTPYLSATSETAPGAWQAFELDLSQLPPCGYTVRLSVADRAIVNSAWTGRSVSVERGLCLRP
jgi:hypothetical protein